MALTAINPRRFDNDIWRFDGNQLSLRAGAAVRRRLNPPTRPAQNGYAAPDGPITDGLADGRRPAAGHREPGLVRSASCVALLDLLRTDLFCGKAPRPRRRVLAVWDPSCHTTWNTSSELRATATLAWLLWERPPWVKRAYSPRKRRPCAWWQQVTGRLDQGPTQDVVAGGTAMTRPSRLSHWLLMGAIAVRGQVAAAGKCPISPISARITCAGSARCRESSATDGRFRPLAGSPPSTPRSP